MQKDGESAPSPAHFFGAEVREARKRAGMSQPELAAIAGYDPSYVSKVETGAITPDDKFISACDGAFPGMHGWFVRFWDESRKWNPSYPPWFKEWLDAERQARVVRTWQPLIIPGLLQTADYARALFRAWQKSEDATRSNTTWPRGSTARTYSSGQAPLFSSRLSMKWPFAVK